MNPCLCIVFAASIAAAPVPAAAPSGLARPSGFEQLERRMQELVEQERFEELARDAEAAFGRSELEPWQRRELAFYALRGYHRMFAATGQPASLCRARQLLRRVEREVGLGDDASIAARLRQVTENGLAQQGPKDPCAAVKSRTATGAPTSTPAKLLPVQRAAPAAPPPAAPERPVPTDISASKSQPAAPTPAPSPTPPPTQPAPDTSTVAPTKPVAPGSAPQLEVGARNHLRDRQVVGSVLLLVGAGLGAGMAAALVHRSEANGDIIELAERAKVEGRRLTSAEFDDIARLADVYRDLTPIAGFTGALATAATIAGVLLLALPQRGRTTARVSASPLSAGITLSGRF